MLPSAGIPASVALQQPFFTWVGDAAVVTDKRGNQTQSAVTVSRQTRFQPGPCTGLIRSTLRCFYSCYDCCLHASRLVDTTAGEPSEGEKTTQSRVYPVAV